MSLCVSVFLCGFSDRLLPLRQESRGSSLASSMGRVFRDSTLGQGGVAVYKAEFEACAMTCVDDHIKLMPSTKRRIADTLSKNS
ncbi:Protein of unknown function DUF842 eukaryotic [Trinorchestia longiramus]|nr:Protein of unknown function DUF842 eukaryotic [Trinorchestia longiramus]